MKSPLTRNIFATLALLVGAATVSKALICGKKMPDYNQMYATPTIGVYTYVGDADSLPDGSASWGGWNGTYADCLQRCKDFGEECYGVHFSSTNDDGICALLRDSGDGEAWGVFEDACEDCYYSDRECPLFCDTPGFCKGGMIRRQTASSLLIGDMSAIESFAGCQEYC